MIKEITAKELNTESFINERVNKIKGSRREGNGDQCPLGRRRLLHGHDARDRALGKRLKIGVHRKRADA